MAVAGSGAPGGLTRAFQPPGTPSQCPSISLQSDGWTRIAPAVQLTQPLADYVVDPANPRAIYETDGLQITRSVNSGCNSQTVYLPQLPADLPNPTNQDVVGHSEITSLAMPPQGTGRVLAFMQTSIVGTASQTSTVATTGDGGQSWKTSLPLIGAPLQLAPANATTVYALTKGPLGAIAWSSKNGGQSFTPGSATVSATHLAVDPNHINHLYAWGPAGVFESGDSGTTFTKVSEVTGPIQDFKAYKLDETTLFEAVHVGGTVSFGIYVASPGAKVKWQKLLSARIDELDRSPGLGIDALFGYVVGDYVAGGKFYLAQRLTNGFLLGHDSGPVGAGSLQEPQAVAGGWLHVRDQSGIWRAHASLNPCGDDIQCPGIDKPQARAPEVGVQLDDSSVRHAAPASIQPVKQVITLHPGQSKKVKLALDLPAEPTPLDVMFLVDTTSSMEPTIDGLKKGINQIVQSLTASGIDVHFGVADFQDYPVAPWGCPEASRGAAGCTSNVNHPEADHPYRRLLPISKPGPALGHALSQLSSDEGNGGDQPEAALAGVFQAVTGQGQIRRNGLVRDGYYVEPGFGANFRPNAVKVLVMSTDQRFHRPTSLSDGTPCGPINLSTSDCNSEIGYPGPSFDTTIAALNTHGVRVVGLDVSGQGFEGPALHDEARLAAATSTFAPTGGIDCDEEGTVHLKAGAPLACPVAIGDDDTALPLAAPILALLKALRDFAPVQMHLTEAGTATSTVAALSPSLFPSVDVKADNVLNSVANLRCPLGADTTHNLTVSAEIRGGEIAHSLIELDCIAEKPYVAAVLAPLIPPFNPPPAPAPPPPANPNPNPNPQINPQLGAASQQEEEAQLAVAGNEETSEEQDAPELTMASTRRTDEAWAYELGVISALSAAAVGFGIRRQRRLYFASSEVRDSRTTVTRI